MQHGCWCMLSGRICNWEIILITIISIAKHCLLTGQEKPCSRITWLFVRLFVRLSPCQKWPNTKENGYWLPPSDHIQSETLFQTRQDQEKEMNGPASLLHSWRWVLFSLMIKTLHCNGYFFEKKTERNQKGKDIFNSNICEFVNSSVVPSSCFISKTARIPFQENMQNVTFSTQLSFYLNLTLTGRVWATSCCLAMASPHLFCAWLLFCHRVIDIFATFVLCLIIFVS